MAAWMRLGQPGFSYFLDFNGDNVVDTSDYYQFLNRYRSNMDANGVVTQLP